MQKKGINDTGRRLPAAAGKPCIRFMMRTRFFILTLTVMAVQALFSTAGYGQGNERKKISLDFKNAPVSKVFSAIEAKADVVIMYENTLLKEEKVTITVKDRSVAEILDDILRNKPLKWNIRENIIRVVPAPAAAEKPAIPSPQASTADRPVSGIVRGTDGNVLPGASVRVKGTSSGTATDALGRFTISAEKGTTLVISFVGFTTTEFKVTPAMVAQQPLVLSLPPAETALEDVVIRAGYYDVIKKEMIGNITKVSAKEIANQPVSNPLAALAGRVAGLDVIQESGLPGTGFTLRLRGLNSVRPEANNPLIIIDGTPYPSGTSDNPAGSAGSKPPSFEVLGYVSTSPLNSINPNDIESIEVLKDADATSIYGSRGGNGVILITTKKGKGGKTAVNLNLSSGMAKMSRKVDVLDRRQYLDMRYEAIKNDGQTIATANPGSVYDLRLWDTTRTTDWQDELLGGTASYTRGQLSVSGGNNNTSFLFSGNYSRETSIFPIDLADTRYNGRLNVNHQSADQKLQVQFSVNYGADNNKLPGWSIAAFALTLPPIAPPLYDSAGKLNWGPNSTFLNPIARLKELSDANTRSFVSSANFSYRLFKGFKVKATLGYNQVQTDAVSKRPQDFFDPTEWLTKGKYLRSSKHMKLLTGTWNAEPQLEYETRIGPGNFKALVGATFQQSKTNGLILQVNNYPDDALMGNTNFGQVDYSYTQSSEYLYNAIFGRLNYNIASKYIVNITARRDGSGRFAPGRRFGNFASAGAAWVFSDEDFVRNAFSFLSFGKLRVSYGTTGNDIIPDYGYLSLYNATNQYNGGLSLAPSGLFNNEYSWETNKKAEAGLELAFLDNRISLATSYYRNRSSNQLVQFPLPSTVGFTSIQSNLPAVIQNTGLELEFSSTNIRRKNFSWNTAFNISFPRNKLVSYPNLGGSPYAYTYVEGLPLSIVKTYDMVRVDPLTGLNIWRSPSRGLDTSNANYLMITDRSVAINTGKELFGGINNTFRYKQFELSLFLNFGKQTGPATYANLFSAGGKVGNMPVDRYERRWQQKGDVTDVQRLTNNPNSPASYANVGVAWNPSYYSTISFLRLKNIAVSYSLPEKTARKAGLQGGRVYVQGQNIFTVTDYKGWDPENQSGNYPLLRVWTAGIEVNL